MPPLSPEMIDTLLPLALYASVAAIACGGLGLAALVYRWVVRG